jgi:hypothetical protein
MMHILRLRHAKQNQTAGILVSTKTTLVYVQLVGRREDCDDDDHDA